MKHNLFTNEYDFTPKEWEKLPFNVMAPYQRVLGDLMEQFPEMKMIPEFKTPLPGLNKDSVLKYIIILYSPTSPLLTRIDDEVERKKVAALEASFPINEQTGSLETYYDDILFMKNEEVNRMVIGYLKRFRNLEWAMLCIGYDKFFTALESSITPMFKNSARSDGEQEKMKVELFKQCGIIKDQIKKLKAEFLTDGSPYLSDSLFSFIKEEKRQLMLSPELRNAARKNGF